MASWQAISIESDNWWAVVIGMFAAWRVTVWKYRGHLSEETRYMVCSFAWFFSGYALNHGWFALSRHLSSDGEKWNLAMYEWRWLAVNITAMMCIWGIVSFMQLIDEFSNGQKYALFLSTYILSRFMGFY